MELYSIEMRDVKSRAGSLRAEQAGVTTRRILDAARRRFVEGGYAATTHRAIAADAGVAVQTVYAVFGSKANILRALRASVVSDPAAGEAYVAALASPSVDQARRSFARSVRLRWEAGYDVVLVDLNAATADAGIRAEVDAANARRRQGIADLAQRLAKVDRRLDPHHVEAVLDALTLPLVYGQLVHAHGWSPDAYESWLADALRRELRQPARARDRKATV